MPIRLYNKDTKALLGEITEAHVRILVEVLEEEHDDDHDYYVDPDTLEVLAEAGADEALLGLIRPHVTEDDGIDVEWRRE